MNYKYDFDADSYIDLNEIQLQARSSVEEKIEQGYYVFENTFCLVCREDSEFEALAEKDRYGLKCQNVICKSCGLIYINPRMTKESYSKFYQEDYRYLYSGHIEDYSKYFDSRYKDGKVIYELLQNNDCISNPNETSVLDVGCGIGGVLKYFADQDFTTLGIDLGKEYIQYGIQNHGLNLKINTIDNLESTYTPDIIIYSHVLEHIVDLSSELKKIHALLKDTGYIYIEVPGVYHLNNYRNDFLRYIQNAHTYSFCLKTLENVMTKHGFELVYGDEHVRSIFKKSKKVSIKENAYPEVIKYLNDTERYRTTFSNKFRYFIKSIIALIKSKTGLRLR